MTLSDLARSISNTEDEARRQLLVQEFLEEYSWEPLEAREKLITERPGPTGDSRYDALLGALAEHFSFHDNLPVPGWAQEPNRFLRKWWFPVNLPSVRADAIAHSPAAFRRRGIFIGQRALERA